MASLKGCPTHASQRHPSRDALRLGFIAKTLPEIPARDRSIRPPGFAYLRQPFGPGHLAQPVGALNGLQNSKIVHREHVRTMKTEHQEHLRRPPPDSLHPGQRLNYVFVRQFVHLVQRDGAVGNAGGQIANVANLLRTETDRSKLLIGETGNRSGRRWAVEQRVESPGNRGSGFGRELLRNDRMRERRERVLVLRVSQSARSVSLHQVANHRVAPCEQPSRLHIVCRGHVAPSAPGPRFLTPGPYLITAVIVTRARISVCPVSIGGAAAAAVSVSARANRGIGTGPPSIPPSSIRTMRSTVRPAPEAAASALARASATARRSASRSSFARSFRSNRTPPRDVAPDATAISRYSPTRSTLSTRTSTVFRAT